MGFLEAVLSRYKFTVLKGIQQIHYITIGFNGHKHSFFSFSIKLMDGIVSQGYLDD